MDIRKTSGHDGIRYVAILGNTAVFLRRDEAGWRAETEPQPGKGAVGHGHGLTKELAARAAIANRRA